MNIYAEYDIKQNFEAIELLQESIACLDVLTLAIKSIQLDYGRAKDGLEHSLDAVAYQIAAVAAYLDSKK